MSGKNTVARRLLVGWVLAGASSIGGCSGWDREHRYQVSACEETLTRFPEVSFLIGVEGTAEICECTVDLLGSEFPDASERWANFLGELDSRMEKRGVLGVVLDTHWIEERGHEMSRFIEAHGEALEFCAMELASQWMGGTS